MNRVLVVATAAAVIAGLTGCGDARTHVATNPPIARPSPGTSIAADKPPAPATWPAYPHFSPHSCWARPYYGSPTYTVSRVAPSYAATPRAHPLAPSVVVQRLLARFGDRRYVRSITVTPAPRFVGGRIGLLYGGATPPSGALQANIVVQGVSHSQHQKPGATLTQSIAAYEGEIAADALRDDLCDAGGGPLVIWKGNAGIGGFAERGFALGQRFPNPSPTAFRKRVALIGKRFGFTISSLRLLRPRQIAPLLIVKTRRSRAAFAKDMLRIMPLLNPSTRSGAMTFEALYFAAEDAKEPFALVQYANRSEEEGGVWGATPCLYPGGFPAAPGTHAPKCP